MSLAGTMAHNVEIKARAPNLAEVRAKVASLTSDVGRVIDQKDTFFHVGRGRLKLREFADGRGELIAYERPDEPGPKASAYTLVPCDRAALLLQALGAVLPIRGEVVKRREIFLIGRTRVHLDEVEGLGSFVELEVVLRDAEPTHVGELEARALMMALGIRPDACVAGAYIDLLEQARSA
jgi:adenylate cyclase class IV